MRDDTEELSIVGSLKSCLFKALNIYTYISSYQVSAGNRTVIDLRWKINEKSISQDFIIEVIYV